MARLGIAPHVVEPMLNHSTGAYNRFQYLPETRAALAMWDRYVAVITDRSST